MSDRDFDFPDDRVENGNLADYMNLAFRLGHISAAMGVHFGEDDVDLAEWQDDIDALGDRMDDLGLPKSRQYIVSFLEQVGSLTENQEFLIGEVSEEAQERMAAHEESIRSSAAAVGTPGFQLPFLLEVNQLEALEPTVKNDYLGAKRSLEEGLQRGHVKSGVAGLTICVESELKYVYKRLTDRSPTRNDSWIDMAQETGVNKVIAATRDVWF